MSKYSDYPEAFKTAAKTYRQNTVDTVTFYVPKGQKQELKEFAAKHNVSLSKLLNRSVEYVLKHPDILNDSDHKVTEK